MFEFWTMTKRMTHDDDDRRGRCEEKDDDEFQPEGTGKAKGEGRRANGAATTEDDDGTIALQKAADPPPGRCGRNEKRTASARRRGRTSP